MVLADLILLQDLEDKIIYPKETSTLGTDGPIKHGLLLPRLSNPPTGGMTLGADGTQLGTAGTPSGDGIPHGGQDPQPGGMATGTPGMCLTGSKEQEFMFLNHK